MGAVGGIALSAPLARLFRMWALFGAYADTLAFVIIVVLITLLTLLVGELVPKRIALHEPERIASAIAGPMMFLSRVFRPLVWLLGKGIGGAPEAPGHQAGSRVDGDRGRDPAHDRPGG